jgi:hypothetical protein
LPSVFVSPLEGNLLCNQRLKAVIRNFSDNGKAVIRHFSDNGKAVIKYFSHIGKAVSRNV